MEVPGRAQSTFFFTLLPQRNILGLERERPLGNAMQVPADGRVVAPEAKLEFSEQLLDVDSVARRIILVVPTERMELDVDRLGRVQSGDEYSRVDMTIVETIRGWNEPVDAVVFDASADPDRTWRFSEDLDEDQERALGYAMVKAQLALYRGLVDAGVYSLTGIGLPEKEYNSFRRGTERLSEEIELALASASPAEATVLRLDLWLLDHLALWTTLSRERFFAARLPELLALVERRKRQLARMSEDITNSGWFRLMP